MKNKINLSTLIEIGDKMPGGFFVYSADAKEEVIYINDIVLDIFDCKNIEEFAELTGNTFSGMVYEEDLKYTEQSIKLQIGKNTKKLDYVEYRIKRKDGAIRWVDDYGRLVHMDIGDVFYVLIRDITDQHDLREMLTDRDYLTGMYNRRHFDNSLHHVFKNISILGGRISLLMIDIDFFKNYNDTYGHLAGDRCLSVIAKTMNKALRRKDDVLYRYGGEEFAVILPGAELKGATSVAENIRKAVYDLNLPFEKSETKRVTVSVGVATIDENQLYSLKEPAKELILMSDKALYSAKKSGRNLVRMFDAF